MGILFSNCKCRNKHKREITLLMIGLDNAGKTSTTKHLLGESTDGVVPTVGFSSIQIKHSLFDITIFDLGGGSKIRNIWKNYYALIYGLIFVVDASDAQRINECRKEMVTVLQDRRIGGKPMLLLINKQDVADAMDESEVCTLLELEGIVNEQQCPTKVEICSALLINKKKKDKGIEKGFEWLIGHIEKHYKTLEERVEKETKEQREREEKEKAERIERVRKIREERERQETKAQTDENKSNDNCDDDDDDVIIGTPFKPANQIREELEKKEAEKISLRESQSPDGAKIIHVSPTNSNKNENNPHSDSELDQQKSSSVDLESDGNGSQIISQQNDIGKEQVLESKHNERKSKQKSKKRFKNKIAPDLAEPNKPRDLPPLQHPFSPHNGWTNGRQLVSNEKINWALAEELLPCGEMTEMKTRNKDNSDWIQSDLNPLDKS